MPTVTYPECPKGCQLNYTAMSNFYTRNMHHIFIFSKFIPPDYIRSDLLTFCILNYFIPLEGLGNSRNEINGIFFA